MTRPVEITLTRLQFATEAVAGVLSFGMIAVWISLVARGMGNG